MQNIYKKKNSFVQNFLVDKYNELNNVIEMINQIKYQKFRTKNPSNVLRKELAISLFFQF